ncbi:type III pantothenate kinase [Marinomonas sp. C2222]|uniref:Type III pantothenate kinase n=1 Tax=Marinomonas sargassi TaxID=2984494 RepID=A0ABT2YVT2_9GAMM|nr:type III pantothenate kinase [Marinomonas sargassi]MCV2404010.1 type III pantothenate kinase [Marinomonas sargassi]
MSVVTNELVVDAGNTSIKFTAFAAGKVVFFSREFDVLVEEGFSPEVIYFASVRSGEDDRGLREKLLALYPDVNLIELQTTARACGVINAYPEPSRLGVDRWLSLIAGYHHVKNNVVVVDVGTAVKVDVVSSEGVHLGGYIAPGLNLMESSLLSNTAKIRYTQSEVVVGDGLPNSTARAVTEGCYEMLVGFLERVYKMHPNFGWVVAGGDVDKLLEALNFPVQYSPNLVAEGARLVGNELLRGSK